VRRLVEASTPDGLALHLNAAQELSQPEGDRDFRGGYSLVQALASAFGERFLVKETGCGIAPAVARRLVDCGVRTIDVSGLGGPAGCGWSSSAPRARWPSWAHSFSSWGSPRRPRWRACGGQVGPSVKLIASGGIRHGLDVAKVLAIGADLAGMALPLFRAQQAGGVAGADAAVRTVVAGLRQALLLTSSRTVADLRRSPRVVTAPLKDWMESL
jgi:isopentenyl-diphosphate delta-isomerase